MRLRLLTCVYLMSLCSATQAQTVTESGWVNLFSETVAPEQASVTAISIGADGSVVWGSFAETASLRQRDSGGGKTTLDVLGQIAGIAVSNGYVFYTNQDGPEGRDDNLYQVLPGQVPAILVSDFPSAGIDPAGITIVPPGWTTTTYNGAGVSAGHLLVSGGDSPDSLYRVSQDGAMVSIILNDPGVATFVDVAASNNAIYFVDRSGAGNNRLFGLEVNGSGTSQVVAGSFTGSPVAVEWDPATANDLLVALNAAGSNDTIVRLTPAGPNSWNATVIGTGFDFDANGSQMLAISPGGEMLAVAETGGFHVYGRCSLPGAQDCDASGVADFCELLDGTATDCNVNFVPDMCDLVSGFSEDCDVNGIPDECATCSQPIHMVFNVDTSSSMDDEANTICSNLAGVVNSLQAEGINVSASAYGIGSVETFSCLTGTVGNVFGTAVPNAPAGPQDTLYESCTASGALEDWGRATSVLSAAPEENEADPFLWPEASSRLVINVAGEGPFCGSPVDEDDGTSINYAIVNAVENDVRVSTILGPGYNSAANLGTEQLAVDLAAATSGYVTRAVAGAELLGAIQAMVRNACVDESDCNDDGVLDSCQLNVGDCNGNGVLDACEGIACNNPPVVVSPVLYRAVGDANTSHNVLSGYSDPEGNGILSIEVQTVSGGPGAALANVNGSSITLTPDSPLLPTDEPSPYVVTFLVCDNGNPTECALASMTVFYNDPPNLAGVASIFVPGEVRVIPFSQFFVDTGVFKGDDPADGDVDGIASTRVSAAVNGPFQAGPVALAGGSTCSSTTEDESTITLTASPSFSETAICYVRVCEEIPPGVVNVCSVTTMTMNPPPPPEWFSDGFEGGDE